MNDPEIERIMQQKMRRMAEEAARTPATEGVIDLDAASFGQAIADPSPIIVDFWAEWCGPCKSMHHIVEEVAAELAGRTRFARVNVDLCAAIAQQFRVQSIPTFIAFSGGREVTRALGAVGADGLRRLAGRVSS